VIKKGVLNLLDSARLSEGSSISIHIAFAMMIIDVSRMRPVQVLVNSGLKWPVGRS
jgi:hypothetical protein